MARDPGDPGALKVLAHVAALYLVFSFALFLGLQVAPIYGNIGIAVTVALAALYVLARRRPDTPWGPPKRPGTPARGP